MSGKIEVKAMAEKIEVSRPSVSHLSVECTVNGNAILTVRDFLNGEALQLGLNISGQYFTPLKSWTDLGAVEREAEIGLQLAPATVEISVDGGLQQAAPDGKIVKIAGADLVAFSGHLLALYRFWFISPAFRNNPQLIFQVERL